MCSYNNVKDVANKYSSILQEQFFTVQLNVIVLEPLNQSKSRVKETILKINNFILCNCFLILTFFYINRVLCEILLICEKCQSKIIYSCWKKYIRGKKDLPMHAYKVE